MIRPTVRAFLSRWAEVGAALLALALGLWTASLGGLVLIPFGLVLAAAAGGWALLALRRARFRGDPGAPGLVELDEARLRYLHPKLGGEIALHDLAELRLVSLRGRQVWHLQDLSGRALLIPLDAAGAADLFDAFAALPGLSSHDLVAALAGSAAPTGSTLPAVSLRQVTVWRRSGSGLRRV